MLTKILKPFVFVLVVMTVVSLACQGGSGTPAPEPTLVPSPVQAPQQPEQPQQQPEQPQPQPEQPQTSTGGYIVFNDRNDLCQFEVPDDWTYGESSGDSYYIDQYKAPDEQALIENIVYDDGSPFTGNSKGKFALALLHRFYSDTGKEGDIRITDDKIMPDGSERLSWTSRGGGYSGMSFFEVRNKTTFLMFTVEWVDGAEDLHVDNLDHAIETYVVP